MTYDQLLSVWWANAYPKEHYALISFAENCQSKGLSWTESLAYMWSTRDPELSSELLYLRGVLGARVFRTDMCLIPGDGVSVLRYGSSSPATVRDVNKRSIVATLDRVYGEAAYEPGGAEARVLCVPLDKTPLTFTRRRDGSFRLRGSHSDRLTFGRKYVP